MSLRSFVEKEYERCGLKVDRTKDPYANFASQLFNLPYEECLEFKNNKPYIIGKERRMIIKQYMILKYQEERMNN